MWQKNDTWLNGKSYVTQDELFSEYQYILNKLSLVLYSDKYYIDAKDFCRSILDFAIDHTFITWKQAHAVMRILTTEERISLFHRTHNPYVYHVRDFRGRKSLTDKEFDKLTEDIFGKQFYPEEEEGYNREYRDDGSRYFSLPTGNESIYDYITLERMVI